MGKRPSRQSKHGASVRIYESTNQSIGNLAEWWRVSRVILIDILTRDRLDALLEEAAPRLRQMVTAGAGPWPEFEAVMRKLFGLKLPGESADAKGEPLSQMSMRINERTHASVSILAHLYDRSIPYLYAAILGDRVARLYGRMCDEMPPRGNRSPFLRAIKESLGLDVPTDLLEESGGELGVRRTFPRDKPPTVTARKTRKKEKR